MQLQRRGPAPATATVVVLAAATADAATTAAAPAQARSCRSNDDCGGGLCVPKAGTKALSDAEDFLGRAMSLQYLVTRLGDSSSSSPLQTIQQRVREDMNIWPSQTGARRGRHQRRGSGGAAHERAAAADAGRRMDAERRDAGGLIIRQFSFALPKAPITTDAQKVYVNINGDSAGLHLDKVIGDLQTFLQDIEVVVAPVNKLITFASPTAARSLRRAGRERCCSTSVRS